MSFSLPFSVFLMILVVLIPMLGLFSAISLALSVFAQTYKEASYYLTPLMIVVMPLMMVALVPAVSLTLGRCLIPVAGVVLLYKELFMGQMNLSHIVLVLTAHLTYAALALVFTIRLFQRESVLFREAQERRWEFWSAGREKQEVFTFHQAMAIFLLAMVFFYFVGPYLAQWHFVAGQVINQIAFLMVFPVLGALLFRLDLKKTFYGKVPRLSEVLSSLLLAVGGLVLARELSVLQRTLIPSDIAHLKEMQKILEKATEGISPLWILVGFSLVPGVCEELFFRGLLLSSCRRQMSTAKSVGLTAFLFAMMHMNFANFTFYLTLGFVLGYLVVRTGSILAAMIAHLANNGLAVVAGSCLRDTALYGTLSDPQAFLPWWITSGALFVFALGLYTLKMQRK